MTEETQKKKQVAKLQAEKGISTQDAEKEVAQKSIEEITGKSAVTAANEVREILEVYDALKTQDPRKITKEKRDTDLKTVKNFQEKIGKNKNLAQDLVSAGLGSEQLSITSGKLEDRIDEVANEMEIHGEGDSQKDLDNPENKHPNEEKSPKSEEYTPDLYPPPVIPSTEKNSANITDDLSKASKLGAELAQNSVKDGIKVEKIVANTAGEVAGTVAEKTTEKVLGKGAVGKIGGKVAKTIAKEAVATTVLSNLGGLGK